MALNLPPIDEQNGTFNLVIETPKGSHNKFKFLEDLNLYKLDKVLPAGAVFPFDFGFLPGTRGADGDPLDALLLIDSPTCVGCLVSARLIGVMEAEETEKGKTYRNDRLIAVAVESREHKDINSLDQLSPELLADIEHFFVSYHEMDNKPFKPLRRAGADRGRALIAEGVEGFQQHKK